MQTVIPKPELTPMALRKAVGRVFRSECTTVPWHVQHCAGSKIALASLHQTSVAVAPWTGFAVDTSAESPRESWSPSRLPP